MEETTTLPKKTVWESRVLVDYKSFELDNILFLRDNCSILIDFLESHKNNRNVKDWEEIRLYSLAQTSFEEALMWAIKAINK